MLYFVVTVDDIDVDAGADDVDDDDAMLFLNFVFVVFVVFVLGGNPDGIYLSFKL